MSHSPGKLLIDAGNQRAKWRFHSEDEVLQGAFNHKELDISGLAAEFRSLSGLKEIWLSNVSGRNFYARMQAYTRHLKGVNLVNLESQDQQCGIQNCYDPPGKLGVDRWLALIGARAQFLSVWNSSPPKNIIVVDAGTAVTVDFLHSSGLFKGGVIFPGLHLMQTSLDKDTQNISLSLNTRNQSNQYMPQVAQNTANAVSAGAYHAVKGGIQSVITQILASKPGETTIALTGGDAWIGEYLVGAPVKSFENLVLDGMETVSAAGYQNQ